MALPASLVNFTSPIVEKALETGARGKTVTTTDYGVIGDAMFKKAQLDLGIANLQSDIGFRQADLSMKAGALQSGLEMQKAELNFGMAKAHMDMRLKNHQLLMELRENEVGFFEGLLNVAAGVAGGAAIAATAGAATPIVVGAGAAGGLLTAGAQAQGGRQGARNALGAIGTISQGAAIIKGASMEQQGKDAWQTWTERAQWLSNMINSPGTKPEHRQQAIREMDMHMANGYSVLTNDMGMNPQAATEAIQGVRQVYMGQGGGMADPSRAKDFNLQTMQQAVEAQADPRFDNPTEARQARKEFLAKAAQNYAMAYAGKEMPASIGEALLENSGINKRPGIMELNKQQGGNQVRKAPEQVRPQDLAGTRDPIRRGQQEDTDAIRVKPPKKGPAIRQPPPAYDSSRVQEAPGRVWHKPLVQGPGLQMDDGQPPVTSPEAVAPLNKQGAETAKILGKEAQASEPQQKKPQDAEDRVDTVGERLMHGGKVGPFEIPGLLSNRGVKQDKTDEIDKPGAGKQPVSGDIKKLTPREAIGKDLPPGAPEADLRELAHKKAQGIEQYVDEQLKGTSGKTAGPQGNLKAVRDAATDLRRYDEILDSLPQGPVKRFLADAANEGKAAEALELVTMVGVTAGSGVVAKGVAKGAVNMAGKLPGKAADKIFDTAMHFAEKNGLTTLAERAGLGFLSGKGLKAGVAGVAKLTLSDKERDAITQLNQIKADLRSELIKSGMIHAGDTKLENEKEYDKLLPQVGDKPRERYRKMISLLNNLEGSAETSRELFGGGESPGKSATGATDRRKAVMQDLDIENKRMRNEMQRRKMEKELEEEAEKSSKRSKGSMTWLDIQ